MTRITFTWALRINASTQPPPPIFPFASSPSSKRSSSAMSQPRSVRIAIVGDVLATRYEITGRYINNILIPLGTPTPLVKLILKRYRKHDDWDLEKDSKALHFLQPDLVLFTGDYGNENVDLVRSISNLDIPKAVILGNHDCWRTHQFSESHKKTDRVQLQLECLGEQHVGYKRLDFSTLQFSVVGGRPFSCGGEGLFRPRLLSARYGVNDMEGSAKKIYEASLGTPERHSIVLLAHNGPTGLGSRMDDICGRDWIYEGGDHGDPDLAQALRELHTSTQFAIPLVVFGHMHKALAYGGRRKMIVVGTDGKIYLNGAIVPRVKHDSGHGSAESTEAGTLHAFTIVEILDGKVEKISETWVLVDGSRIEVREESTLFQSSHNAASV